MNPSKPWSLREQFPAERGQEQPPRTEPAQRSQVSAHIRVPRQEGEECGNLLGHVKGGTAAGKHQGKRKLQRWVMEMGLKQEQAVTATSVTRSEVAMTLSELHQWPWLDC